MKKKLSESNAIVVGLAKNCEDGLKKTITRLDQFRNTFKNVEFRIIINDCTDETENVLDQWSASRADIQIIKLLGIDENIPNRTARLAVLRNLCLEELRQLHEKISIDYFLVLDLDGLNHTLISDPQFSDIIENAPNDWGALFANQPKSYYDIWALRHPTWCPNDCFLEIRKYRRNPINWIINFGKKRTRQYAFKKFLWDRQKPISIDQNPIEVDSAFGGFGIYKNLYLHEALYRGLAEKGRQVCEHVHFNACVKKNGAKLYIMPKLMNDFK